MGSGASKINSNDSGFITESRNTTETISLEKNNNFVIDKSTAAVTLPLQSEKAIQRSRLDTTQKSEPKKIPFDRQTSVPKDVSTKTEVVRFKSSTNEAERKENEKPSDTTKRLNEELAASESQRLDLLDQIQLLKENNASKEQETGDSPNHESLQETLNAKDQYILKLERETKTNQVEANKLRIKLKKRIKALTNQLHEVRQEASINQMELKAEITRQAEQIKLLQAGGSLSSSVEGDGRSFQDQEHPKIIVELSNQLSEQSEQISSLEADLLEKKKEISDLKLAISNHYDSKDIQSTHSILPQTSTDRLHSSRGRRKAKTGDRPHESKPQNGEVSFGPSPTFYAAKDSKNPPQTLERQSTCLSDSDSDWGGDSVAPSHTHSAPARSRVKSAISLASSGKHKGSLVTLNGNDDSIMDLVSASPIDPLEQRVESTKKSCLKNHLEKARVESQSNSLIGPTLAFEKTADPFSDTSCEPTPRPPRGMFQSNSKIRIVKPINH